ncbi:hypothetical protein BRADI_1g23365v3 [Brachypodium distachyon]|uniref:F-box associated beta-propeller type 1 domain-containing protein n=2 Tax=Brachypodium distachyon TaxID=15368 RepID=A0A0Q3GWW1_BRADI|nr:hypothetical protein BRADI_1g23365v3 [Brachypodium distachyon]
MPLQLNTSSTTRLYGMPLQPTRIVSFDFSARGEHGSAGHHHHHPPQLPPRALWFTSPLFTLPVGSWDGVVCLRRGSSPDPHGIGFRDQQYVLWNPVAMACATVRAPQQRLAGYIVGGYAHPGTGRFHLLHASCRETHGSIRISPTLLRILRVGDDAWRELPFPKIVMNTCNVVRLHDSLHWLAQPSSGSETYWMESALPLQVLVFDTTREKFWLMETPAELAERPLREAQLGVLSKKLCIFTVEPSSSTMEVWVLDGYGSGGATPRRRCTSWRLEERIGLITWDGYDLSRVITTVHLQVDVGENEEEILVTHVHGRIDAYSAGRKAWRHAGNLRTSFLAVEFLVMHRESLVRGQVSFGKATRDLLKYVDHYGQRFYCL